MKLVPVGTSMSSNQLTCLLFLTALLGCRHQADELVLTSPPTQRVVAKTTLYVSMNAQENSFDTVQTAGVSYPIMAQDSIHYVYDVLQRLTSKTLTQTFLVSGKPYLSATRNEYTYQGNWLVERSGIGPQGEGIPFKYPLDSTGHRVTAHIQTGYSFVNFDSLRIYSGEGILTSAIQINYNPTYPPSNKHTPTVKIIIELGNITRIESYSGSGKLHQITRFIYDNKHYAPRATDTFLGETSRNVLIRRIIITYESNETLTSDFTYSNEYDSQGRLISQVEYALPTKYSAQGNKILTKFYY